MRPADSRFFVLAAAAVAASGCIRVHVPLDRAGGNLVCSVVGRRKVECAESDTSKKPLSVRVSLRGQRSDLRQYEPTMAGGYLCLVSAGSGYDCVNLSTWDRLRPSSFERLENRSFVQWENGLCVETHRDSGFSRFECVQAGSVEDRATFWVSSSHETVGFGRGACVCGQGDGDASQRFRVDPWGGVGAACMWGGEGDPSGLEATGALRERSRLVTIQGEYGVSDFGEVCELVDGLIPADAVGRLEELSTGSAEVRAP